MLECTESVQPCETVAATAMTLAKGIGFDSERSCFVPTPAVSEVFAGHLAFRAPEHFPQEIECQPRTGSRRRQRLWKRCGHSGEWIPSVLASIEGRRYGGCHGHHCFSCLVICRDGGLLRWKTVHCPVLTMHWKPLRDDGVFTPCSF